MQCLHTLVTSGRYIIIQIDDVILVNVYLPSVHCTNDFEDVLLDVLSDINIAIQQTPKVIITGDLNIDFNHNSKGVDILKKLWCRMICSFVINLSVANRFHCIHFLQRHHSILASLIISW